MENVKSKSAAKSQLTKNTRSKKEPMNDIENLATPATEEPVPNNPDSEELIDLEAIRMSQSFGAQSEVRKLLTTVPVRKPNRTQFCRTHADYRLDVHLLKYGEADDSYIVTKGVLAEVLQLAKAYRLVLAVDRLGTSFIWPLALPDPERPNAWHLSAMEADNAAQQHWVRVQSNQALGAYEVYEAQGELTDPVWPEESWQKLVHVAFKGKIIDTHDHIVLQKLRGEL